MRLLRQVAEDAAYNRVALTALNERVASMETALETALPAVKVSPAVRVPPAFKVPPAPQAHVNKPDLPIRNYEAMDKVEADLEDLEAAKILVSSRNQKITSKPSIIKLFVLFSQENKLIILGGKTDGQVIRRVCCYCFAPSLTQLYTWHGVRKGKRPLKDLRIAGVIERAMAARNITMYETAAYIGNWFRQTGDRHKKKIISSRSS